VNQELKGGRLIAADARQLEECCYRYWKIGGALIAVGVVLMLTSMLFWLGAPLAAAGAAVIVGNIVWFLRVNQQASIMVTCPHCAKEHNVLPGFHNFVCDECEHEVPVPRAA
jgi:hypothetical protein